MRLIFGWLGRICRSGRAARISSQSQRNSCARSWWTTLAAIEPPNVAAASALLELDDAAALPQRKNVDVVALDDALNALAEVDPRQSRVVELRFFAGLSVGGNLRGDGDRDRDRATRLDCGPSLAASGDFPELPNMSSGRWERTKEILEQALRLAPQERQAYLAQRVERMPICAANWSP